MFVAFYLFGCQSKVQSLINEQKQVDRAELQNEVEYLVGLAKARAIELDRQDALKRQLVDAAAVIGSTGEFNPAGLISMFTTIGGIAFGLDRNYRRKLEVREITEKVKNDSPENTTGTA